MGSFNQKRKVFEHEQADLVGLQELKALEDEIKNIKKWVNL